VDKNILDYYQKITSLIVSKTHTT